MGETTIKGGGSSSSSSVDEDTFRLSRSSPTSTVHPASSLSFAPSRSHPHTTSPFCVCQRIESLSKPFPIPTMAASPSNPGSGAATPTNQQNGAAPLPSGRKDALAIISRDFRSDTITIPDEEMIQLMATATVGDDVYKQDKATNQLQERIAKLAGKEAALFCVSGTMQGMVMPHEETVRISEFAREKGIAMHCDGARMWEVQAKTGLSLKELCAPFETVSLCMSKGLGAPIGSVLVGPKNFIEKARWFRKMFGGGIRQSGGIAAAADYALTRTLPLLPKVHELAAHLASSLQELGVVLLNPTETNMVWIDTSPLGFSPQELTRRALDLDNGQKRIVLGGARIVLHFQITREAVDDLIQLVTVMKKEYSDPKFANGHTNGTEESASPYDIRALKKALVGQSVLKKTGENSVAYGGN